MSIPFLWERLTCNDEAASMLARELKISPAIALVLVIGGIDDLEGAQRFLRPSLDHLHDPFKLADMAPAVERILAAIERKERIAIHGDYVSGWRPYPSLMRSGRKWTTFAPNNSSARRRMTVDVMPSQS